MHCTNCGANIPEDSKFCHNCGESIKTTPKTTKTKKAAKTSKEKTNSLFDRFAEIYNSRDEERDKYIRLTSSSFWELLDRVHSNLFETYITNNKDPLNKLPYKAIEGLKDTYYWSMLSGYWFWVAEAIRKSENLKSLGDGVDLDQLIKTWQELAIDKYRESIKLVSNEVFAGMQIMVDHQMKQFLDISPAIKELANDIIEEIKTNLQYMIILGYFGGVAESKFR
ncbi:MAG: zinc-ribbon domain-containing protein [Candidatus Levybacteria bacterium]|nr:zinc-ribbon domain-containing protein [Candidatus Levybacteria bacterium]